MNPRWLVVLALALIGLPALWWHTGGIGIMPGRSVLALFGVLLVVGAWRPGPLPGGWRGALPWLAAALMWQTLSLLWSPLVMVGLTVLAERFVALAVAVVLGWRLGAAAAPTAAAIAALIALLDVGSLHAGLTSWISADLPFGNPNFNASAMALAVLGAARWSIAQPGERAATVLAGCGFAVMLAPAPLGHGTRAIAVIAATGVAAWIVLRWLPRRLHGPAFLLGALVFFAGQWAVSTHGVAGLPPSWEQRRHLWTAAVEALATAPLQGHGLGSAVTILTTGPAADRAWLAVPSWPEHAHDEVLQTAVEGGLVLVALLTAALVMLLRPLWRQRDEPAARALLIAWAAAVTHALVESHLLHPGPMGCLAVLAAATWGYRATEPTPISTFATRGLRAWMLGAAACASLLIVGDFTTGGSPPMHDRRYRVVMDEAESRQDWGTALAATQALRQHLGPLDDLALREARQQAHLKAYPESIALVCEQARRLPVVPGTLDLVRRLAERHRKRHEPEAAAALTLVWHEAAIRVQAALAAVPASAKNAEARAALSRELAAPPRNADDLRGPLPTTP